jgi:hypothetical protein
LTMTLGTLADRSDPVFRQWIIDQVLSHPGFYVHRSSFTSVCTMSPTHGNQAALACADCHVVPSMTSQCTDQCVVVACSDEAPICDMECPGNHCDLVCEDASNCKDCNGFDEFVRF